MGFSSPYSLLRGNYLDEKKEEQHETKVPDTESALENPEEQKTTEEIIDLAQSVKLQKNGSDELLADNDHEYTLSWIAELDTSAQQAHYEEYYPNFFYLFGDFLYFKAIEDSLVYAEKVPQTATFQPKVKNVKQHFEYKPGFRVGAGYDFDQYRWKLRSSWMYYKISPAKRHAFDPNFSLLAILDIPVWGALGNSLTNSVKGKWNLEMDVIDLDVRRHFDLKGFSLDPVGGIKCAFIKQKIQAQYGDFKIDFSDVVTPHNIEGKSLFFGIGPLLGMEIHYKLSKQWHFFLNGNFSWLVGHFYTKTTYTEFTPGTPADSKIEIKNHTSRVCLFEQVQAGIDKQWIFKKSAFGITLGWELQVFQHQMNLNYFSNFVSPPSEGDLSLYGPFIRANIDF